MEGWVVFGTSQKFREPGSACVPMCASEMKERRKRRQADGSPTIRDRSRRSCHWREVINCRRMEGSRGKLHYAVLNALKERFNLNVPATARPQLKEATIQFLRNRTVRAPALGRPPKGMIPLGQWGEAWLSNVLRGVGIKPSIPLKTSLTYRFVDRHVDRIAHEAKAGLNVKLNDRIRTQILKDRDLIKNGHFDAAHWHFFQGAQPDVLNFLEQNSIGYTVY